MPSTRNARNTISRPPSSSGRMSPESSPTTDPTPSDAFWAHWPEKAARSNRQGDGGRTLVVSLDPAVASRGGCSTRNISELPNAAAACFLWQVVETISIPPRYFLSPVACTGILRRAAKRGKSLPDLLAAALTAQATLPTDTIEIPASPSASAGATRKVRSTRPHA